VTVGRSTEDRDFIFMCYYHITTTAKALRRSRYCPLNHPLVVACIRLTGEAVPAVLLWPVVIMFRFINGFDVRSTTKYVVASITENTVSATSILDAPLLEKQADRNIRGATLQGCGVVSAVAYALASQ
jgi:hypothetical protein